MKLLDLLKKRNTQKTKKQFLKRSKIICKEDKNIETTVEILPTSFENFKNNLVEITDPIILARLDSLVPNVSKVVKSPSNNKEVLYKVVLKSGTKLANSHAIKGAKRALIIGNKGIVGHANLLEVGGSMLNPYGAVFNVASIIVGQYYMHQIDTKILAISNELKEISATLDIQYKSQVASLIESVMNITKFQIDIILKDELRLRELTNIQELRKNCQTMLFQSESEIETILSSKPFNYEAYVSLIKKIEKWSSYQSILVQTLSQINELDFALNMGIKSKEYCYGNFGKHIEKSEAIHKEILDWHKEQCDHLQIDIKEEKRKNTGLFTKIFGKPISAIKKDWIYKSLDKDVVTLIKNQTGEMQQYNCERDNVFMQDVEIVIKGDKKYYLSSEEVSN